jgi:hypothetical protein
MNPNLPTPHHKLLLPRSRCLLRLIQLLLQRILQLLQLAAVLTQLSLAVCLLRSQLLSCCAAAGDVLHCLISSSCNSLVATPAALRHRGRAMGAFETLNNPKSCTDQFVLHCLVSSSCHSLVARLQHACHKAEQSQVSVSGTLDVRLLAMCCTASSAAAATAWWLRLQHCMLWWQSKIRSEFQEFYI